MSPSCRGAIGHLAHLALRIDLEASQYTPEQAGLAVVG
jgi:hypothetical protein